MVLAKVRVNGVCAELIFCKIIPKGIVGARVEFEYSDPMWDELTKTVVFRSNISKDILNVAESVIIPSEVVAEEGHWLSVGIYGVNQAGDIVIPTLWVDLDVVRDATDPSRDISTDPTPPVWVQLQQQIKSLEQRITTPVILETDGDALIFTTVSSANESNVDNSGGG